MFWQTGGEGELGRCEGEYGDVAGVGEVHAGFDMSGG